MVRATPTSTLYLRLPPRLLVRQAAATATATATATALAALPLSFAWTLRTRLQRADLASLADLAPLVAQAARVVLLLAPSDVTLLRMAVPPLPAARLSAALPALVEDRVIGDLQDCAIAAGPDIDGQRTIAVTDREWLQQWLAMLQHFGARRLAALPLPLCLPLPAGYISAALLDFSGGLELALRTSADEAFGLPQAADSAEALRDNVLSALVTFAGGRAVRLSLPPTQAPLFHAWVADHPDSGIALVEDDWATWVEGASQVSVDLASAAGMRADTRADWQRWRWPLRLGLTLLLLNLLALNADWWRLRREGRAVEQEMVAIYQRVFPGAGTSVQPVQQPLAQMRQRLAAARQAAGEFAGGDFLVLSAALGEVWAASGNEARAIASLDYRDATLNVRLRPGAQASLEAMRTALAARRLSVTPSATDPSLWQVRSAP